MARIKDLPDPKPVKQSLSAGIRGLISINGDDWLLSHVDAWLEGFKEKDRTDAGWFHPSSLSNKCDAFLAFEYLGFKRSGKVPPRTRRIFDLGHGRDADWKMYLEKSGLSVAFERAASVCERCGDKGKDTKQGRHVCFPELRIRGSFDDLIAHPVSGRRMIAEVKTKNDGLWKALKAPDEAHVIQVQTYMVGTGTTDAVIIYENKNDQYVKTFNVPLDSEMWNGIVNRLNRIREQLDAKVAPMYTPIADESKCPFYTICRKHNFQEAK